MPASATWPSHLPQKLLQDGYQEGLADNLIRSQVDAGPEKRRPRFTSAPRPLRGVMRMTRAQLDSLETFFNTTVKYGADPFNFPKPGFDSGTYEVVFTGPPSWTTPGGDNYDVTLDMRIQP